MHPMHPMHTRTKDVDPQVSPLRDDIIHDPLYVSTEFYVALLTAPCILAGLGATRTLDQPGNLRTLVKQSQQFVPSPWDSFIFLPASPQTSSWGTSTPYPLSSNPSLSQTTKTISIPRLVPESDDGNVEYKLQLLSPSPARLVTQHKWRLLEGGHQVHNELGVSNSGDLIGLPREYVGRSLR